MKYPLDELDLQTRLNLLFAKIRNIIYYRTEIEPKDPTRIRCQYMHVLRGTREEICILIGKLDEVEEGVKNILKDLLNLIPKKIKTDECLEVILKMRGYFEDLENGGGNKVY